MQGFTVSWWRRVLRHRRWLQVVVVVCLGYILIVKLPSLITKVLRNTAGKLGNSATSAATTLGSKVSKRGMTTYPLPCGESVMSPKAHGTCLTPVQKPLRWQVDWDTADRICCFNRHYAEHSGYWEGIAAFKAETDKGEEITFYDSVTGKPLFIAPRGRTMDEFKKESRSHGWPSFRDEEVVWDNMRCLPNGESVSIDGTHLGHNLPDKKGNRYCINLVSVAGNPP